MEKRKLKTLVIDRSRWRRGAMATDSEPKGTTRLLNNKGFMCCLGFDALACGLSEDQILGVTAPSLLIPKGRIDQGTHAEYVESRCGLCCKDTPVHSAMVANDSDTISEATREKRVRAALRKLGWDKVIFV